MIGLKMSNFLQIDNHRNADYKRLPRVRALYQNLSHLTATGLLSRHFREVRCNNKSIVCFVINGYILRNRPGKRDFCGLTNGDSTRSIWVACVKVNSFLNRLGYYPLVGKDGQTQTVFFCGDLATGWRGVMWGERAQEGARG